VAAAGPRVGGGAQRVQRSVAVERDGLLRSDPPTGGSTVEDGLKVGLLGHRRPFRKGCGRTDPAYVSSGSGPSSGRVRADEQPGEGARDEEGAERDGRPAARSPGEDQGAAVQRPEEESGEGAEQQGGPAVPAEDGARAEGEFDVAESHPAGVDEEQQEVAGAEGERAQHGGGPAAR